MPHEQTVMESLLALLIERGLIDHDDTQQMRNDFINSTQSSFTDFVREEGLVEPEDLLDVLSELYQKPAFDVVGHFFDHQLLLKFPKGFLLRRGIIPLEVDGNMLVVVAADPEDPELLAEIGEHVSYDIRFNVGLRDDICDAVKEFYDTSLTETTEDDEPDDQELELELVGADEDD